MFSTKGGNGSRSKAWRPMPARRGCAWTADSTKRALCRTVFASASAWAMNCTAWSACGNWPTCGLRSGSTASPTAPIPWACGFGVALGVAGMGLPEASLAMLDVLPGVAGGAQGRRELLESLLAEAEELAPDFADSPIQRSAAGGER